MTSYRVFCLSRTEPAPAALAEHLRSLRPDTVVNFLGDRLGWMRAEVDLGKESDPLVIERFLVEESDMRPELNSWVAWLETADHPRRESVIDRVVNSQQVFTLEVGDELVADKGIEQLAKAACQYLAQQADGIYQIDEAGFFSADGLLLVPEYRIV
jgi:hypothetical protein